MALSPENVDTEIDQQRIMENYEIMYLARRPSYEFCLAIPRGRATHSGEERPLLHMRFKDQCQMPGLVLEVGQMEDFFEGLSRLMEYVRAEEAKRQE
jgi:hypothetical protein